MKPFVTKSTAVQSIWSTCRSNLPALGLPCQLMRTFWPAFVPQGREEGAHANSLQQLHIFVSENHHGQVSFPFAAPYHEHKHDASQAITLVGTPQAHTIHSPDRGPAKSLRTTPTNLNLLGPASSAAQHGVSQNLEFQSNHELPNLEQFWHTPQSQSEEHGYLSR